MSVANRRRKERERRRQTILEAAQRVFASRGLAAATMDQVAAEAELSKGTLYLYFPSKDELFMVLAAEVIERAHQAMADARDPSLCGLDEFRALCRAYVATAFEYPNTIRNAIIWMAGGDTVDTESEAFRGYRSRVEKNQKFLMDALERGRADGSIRAEVDPMMTVVHVWPSMMLATVIRLNVDELRRRFPAQVDPDALVPGLLELFVRGLASPSYQPPESSP